MKKKCRTGIHGKSTLQIGPIRYTIKTTVAATDIQKNCGPLTQNWRTDPLSTMKTDPDPDEPSCVMSPKYW